ncbi:hypothetical protein KIH31_10630 [Paenarthrobacter sp. DKR-5]|uniref:LolA family protein n=1 Tax=Paenarthrobacter sp. DKR-5 TaxID=2835535 RepID=UPI001BDD95A1|nr:hypothetical protein [Paenarthrobacter sp. DKR-5]MBT1003062.1 hypothetical protein [Paenarthrobacter sp. DKR-5]
MNRTWKRWMPAAVVPAVLAAGTAVSAFQANTADLPAKTPAQLIEMIAASKVDTLSGTLEQTSDLGLPELPATGPGANAGAASALELLTGSHTARIYLGGPSKVRLQVMDRLAERDVVRSGNQLWFYTSKDNTASHLTLPAASSRREVPAPAQTGTPAELAQRLLAAADRSTEVSVGPDTQVAGRKAYTLMLTPRAADTLIGQASVAVDAGNGLPLSVSVRARGQQDPAFRLAFESVSFQTPSADLFRFEPPAGATVKQQTVPQAAPSTKASHPAAKGAKAKTSGRGWDAVAELPAGSLPAGFASSGVLSQLSRPVAGGRLLSTSLVNVLLTDDGRVLAGSVAPERLQAAAAGR